MTIKLVFYKAPGTIFSKIIRLWTKSDYSHVEMIMDDKWISSDAKFGGVRILPLHSLNHDDWDYVEVDVDGRAKKKVLAFIEENKDAKYDWAGLFLGTVFDISAEDRTKFFCSEMMTLILQMFKEENAKNLIPAKTSPGDLARIYMK